VDSTGIKAEGEGALSADCFAIAFRATDGAYDTRKCHDAIAARKAHAVIPPRKNAKLWKPPLVYAGMHCRAVDTPGARARNEAVRSSKYLGRALWRQLTGYHRRSRVETTLSWFAGEP